MHVSTVAKPTIIPAPLEHTGTYIIERFLISVRNVEKCSLTLVGIKDMNKCTLESNPMNVNNVVKPTDVIVP